MPVKELRARVARAREHQPGDLCAETDPGSAGMSEKLTVEERVYALQTADGVIDGRYIETDAVPLAQALKYMRGIPRITDAVKEMMEDMEDITS